MAILFITHKFPPSIGGMQRQSYELINGMRRHTRVYTLHQLPTESKVQFFVMLKTRVKKLLRKHPDIHLIHCNDGMVASFCTWIKDFTDVPVCATIHGMDITFPSRIFQNYIIPRLKRFDHIYAVSAATKAACIDKGLLPSRVTVICNGVDHGISNIPMDTESIHKLMHSHGLDMHLKKIVLSVGRAVTRKGFSWFARHVLPKLNDDVVYVIVGPKVRMPIFDFILKFLPSRLAQQITLFFGYETDLSGLSKIESKKMIHIQSLEFKNLMQMISAADLLVMPNVKVEGDMEGFGLVALEAALRNTYVVASEIEGITSAVFSGSNGELLDPEKANIWIQKISTLLNDPDELHDKASNASAFVKKTFSWDKMVNAYYAHFKTIMSLNFQHINHQLDKNHVEFITKLNSNIA